MKRTMNGGITILRRKSLGTFVNEKRGIITDSISSLFILLFMYTAISKSLSIDLTADVLRLTPSLSDYALPISWGIVVSEYLVSLLLFFPATRIVGLYGASLLMLGFTGYIGYMMIFAPELPCTCGGIITELSWSQHLILNLLLIFLAFFAIVLTRQSLKKNILTV